MAMRCVLDIFLLILLFFCIIIAVNGGELPPKVFDVVKYGAVPDGKTDNTQVSSSSNQISIQSTPLLKTSAFVTFNLIKVRVGVQDRVEFN